MQKILFKTTNRKSPKGLSDFLFENKIEAKFQDFSNEDEIAGNFNHCFLSIDFDSENETEIAKKFMNNNKHLRFCAYFENMNRNSLNSAHLLGCDKFCYDFKSLKNILSSSETKISRVKTAFSKFKNAKVLLVDDVQINLEVLGDILLPFCFEMHPHTSAKEALNAALNVKFDLIFLDISMPEINGFELAKKIKKSKLNSNTSIIFVTGDRELQSKIKCYTLGSIAYIEKPLEPETMRAQVYGILETRALQNEIIDEKENFIQMLTHDLKTPIGAQISVVKLLLSGKFGHITPEQKELISEILSSNKYMLTMVRNVLAKYKYENDSMQITKSAHKIENNIVEILNEFRFLFDKKGIKTKLSGDFGIDLRYDEIEIKRVLNNLISNAAEHCNPNSAIEIELKRVQDNLFVKIINLGSGLLEEDLEKIFNKYTSKAKRYRKVGFGLGLYICKEIVKAHGGDIVAKIQEAKGVECKNSKRIIFEFNLPIVDYKNTANETSVNLGGVLNDIH